ncbi:EcoKI restriction-modification system protein HsdS [Shewanella sp. P1-14-1]|uniref:restriction endonuclease subunit S n=1 Tax=Shewanella sp. P1-14-1 TaxID=1723761 RepID=UPI0006D667CF|nr:restriction endonuclease subunit S [Shewanella sp. P1-14-1]KPZ71257.1 EcoKI restriction-modification system protein HsdS [Shewanella sp. P1-14-1]
MKVTLDEVAVIKAGHPFRGSIKESEQGNGYVIQTRDQNADGQIYWEKLTLTDVVGRKDPDWLVENDIIFTARGARNLASVMPDISKPIVCSPHYFQIRVNSANLLPEFLGWQLNQVEAQRYFQQSAEGSAQVSIRRNVLDKTPITIPPLETQYQVLNIVKNEQRQRQIYQKLIELKRLELDAITQSILKESTN